MDANRIRVLREAKGITPTELAFRIGRSYSVVTRYETGEAQPSIETAKRIASVLDSTLDELFPAGEPEAA